MRRVLHDCTVSILLGPARRAADLQVQAFDDGAVVLTIEDPVGELMELEVPADSCTEVSAIFRAATEE